eukprot:175022_1
MISSYQYIRCPYPVQYFVYNLNSLKCAITCSLNLSTAVIRVIPIPTDSHDFTSSSFGAYHIHHQCVSVISTFFLVIIPSILFNHITRIHILLIVIPSANTATTPSIILGLIPGHSKSIP